MKRIGDFLRDPVEQMSMHVMRQPDPELRQQQLEIKQMIAHGSSEDIKSLQAQCALIGHVPSVIKGPEREVCYYCGAKIE